MKEGGLAQFVIRAEVSPRSVRNSTTPLAAGSISAAGVEPGSDMIVLDALRLEGSPQRDVAVTEQRLVEPTADDEVEILLARHDVGNLRQCFGRFVGKLVPLTTVECRLRQVLQSLAPGVFDHLVQKERRADLVEVVVEQNVVGNLLHAVELVAQRQPVNAVLRTRLRQELQQRAARLLDPLGRIRPWPACGRA